MSPKYNSSAFRDWILPEDSPRGFSERVKRNIKFHADNGVPIKQLAEGYGVNEGYIKWIAKTGGHTIGGR